MFLVIDVSLVNAVMSKAQDQDMRLMFCLFFAILITVNHFALHAMTNEFAQPNIESVS